MPLKILCTPDFNKSELAAIDRIAAEKHTTREKIVRRAVRFFAAQCVPTHGKAARNMK